MRAVGRPAGWAAALAAVVLVSINSQATGPGPREVKRGRRRVLKRTASGRRGSHALKLSALPAGRYTLTVFAIVQKRSMAVTESFRVR